MNTSYNNDNKSDNLNNSTENEDFIDGCSDSDKDSILNDDYDIDSPDYDADDDYTDKDDIDEDDADAVFDRQEKAKKRSNIVRHIVLVISAAVFIFAAYNLINIFLAYHKADVIYDNIGQDVLDEDSHTKVIIGEDEQPVEIPFTYNHQALLNINSQGIGYMYIPSIDCRLPMVQGDDNDYYLTHTFNK